MREYLIDLIAAALFVLAGLAMAWRYERFRRRVDARLAEAARQDDMAVADAVREVPPVELAAACDDRPSIRRALREVRRIDDALIWLELDSYTTEER